MTVRICLCMAVAVATTLILAAPASAECHYVQEEVMVDGVVQIRAMLACPDPVEDDLSSPVADTPEPPRDSDLDAVCVRTALEADIDPFEFCDVPSGEDPPGENPPEVTPGLVSRALARIPLPPANLIIQPPNGRTLVNFDTNFYTDQGEIPRSLTMLGRQVDLRIWPASFHWNFGDGQVLDSTSPGAPYPDLEITHSYRNKGTVHPSVDVTYAAQFRVDGGPWQDVPGTVTIAGTPQQLRVVTARPVLVGG